MGINSLFFNSFVHICVLMLVIFLLMMVKYDVKLGKFLDAVPFASRSAVG